MKTIAVLGLGKFGYYIAKSLARMNFTVIAVDNDEQKVQYISEHIDNAFVLDSTSKHALEEVGIYNLDTVIVSIGENIEASILTVMALKDLGNKNIIAKAITSTHGEILAKIGAFKIVYPEKIAGRKLVKNLVDNITFDEIDVSNHLKVIKFLVPTSIIGKKLLDIESENQDVKMLAHKHDGNWNDKIDNLDITIEDGDMLAFFGEKRNIECFYKKISA